MLVRTKLELHVHLISIVLALHALPTEGAEVAQVDLFLTTATSDRLDCSSKDSNAVNSAYQFPSK